MNNSSPVKHILVLVDGTKESSHAADFAIGLAKMLRARLTAMAVVETETLRQLLHVQILTNHEMVEFQHDLRASAEHQIEDVRERAMRHRVEIEEVIVAGNSEEAVPREVAERSVDLIALGGFHSRRATRDLMARQRQQIVDHATCAVVVVK